MGVKGRMGTLISLAEFWEGRRLPGLYIECFWQTSVFSQKVAHHFQGVWALTKPLFPAYKECIGRYKRDQQTKNGRIACILSRGKERATGKFLQWPAVSPLLSMWPINPCCSGQNSLYDYSQWVPCGFWWNTSAVWIQWKATLVSPQTPVLPCSFILFSTSQRRALLCTRCSINACLCNWSTEWPLSKERKKNPDPSLECLLQPSVLPFQDQVQARQVLFTAYSVHMASHKLADGIKKKSGAYGKYP